jgi:surfactin synthase thioesterase subunit
MPPAHQLPDEEFIARLRSLNGAPEEVWRYAELRALLLPALRADFALCETYAYRADSPLPVPVTALGGRDDPRVTPDELAAWGEQTAAFRQRWFAGSHFFLRGAQAELLAAVAEALQEHTGAAEAGVTSSRPSSSSQSS